jgi:dolichol-phosphate mannosyltransferase
VSLGLAVQDATDGYRAYRATTLERLALDEVGSQGSCFQIDNSLRVHRAGGRIVEVPKEFVERRAGESKLSRAIVAEAFMRVTTWSAAYRTRQIGTAPKKLTPRARRR